MGEDKKPSGRFDFFIKLWSSFLLTIFTLSVSCLSLYLTYSQWKDESAFKSMELDQNEKATNIEIATFITEHGEEIFGDDEYKRQIIRDVMLLTFPREITDELFNKLVINAKSVKAMQIWAEGKKKAEVVNEKTADQKFSRIYIQYNSIKDRDLVEELTGSMSGKGYTFGGDAQLVTDKIENEIRYFHEEDRQSAETLVGLVNDFFAGKNLSRKVVSRYMSEFEAVTLKGTIEIWISE